jgi:hypothetical protein
MMNREATATANNDQQDNPAQDGDLGAAILGHWGTSSA